MRYLSLALAAAALMLAFAAPAARAQQIGVVASLEPRMAATAPGQTARSLAIGAGVVSNDEVRTTDTSRGQLLFNDQTTLSVAPSSTIVLDEFVFDPAGGGTFGLQLAQGALRFVGGQTSEAEEAVITTPTATIGVRGSSVLVSYIGGRTVAIFLMGDRLCVTANGRRQCTSRQGGVMTEDGYQGPVSPDYLAWLITRIDGAPPGQLTQRPGDAGLRDRIRPQTPPKSTRGEDGRRDTPDLFYDDSIGTPCCIPLRAD